jgi:hypothetical protein
MRPLLIQLLAIAVVSCATPGSLSKGESSMDGLLEVRNVAVSIHRSPADVYDFVSNGENVPRWAHGLGTRIRRAGEEWIAEGPIGEVRVRFVPRNDLGVADHDVTTEAGLTVHNPVRVIPNGTGSTVIFTLLRRPDVSEQQFTDDAKAVARDLETLKALLE